MKQFLRIFASFFSPSAWALIVVGAMLLTSRVPSSSQLFVNLPELVTILQLAGGIFILCGFGIVCSQVFWPQVLVADLLVEVRAGNVAAAIVVAGLKVFCGLALIAFALWLALTSTGLAGVHNG